MTFFSLTFVNINKSLVGVSSWAGFHEKKSLKIIKALFKFTGLGKYKGLITYLSIVIFYFLFPEFVACTTWKLVSLNHSRNTL